MGGIVGKETGGNTLFALWLGRQREFLGLTTEALAAEIGPDCDANSVGNWGIGIARPSTRDAEKLARIFHVPASERSAFVLFATSDLGSDLTVDTSSHAGEIASSKSAPDAGFDPSNPWRVRPHPPSNLPVQLTNFIGREDDVLSVTELLRTPKVRLLTLLGPPGIGKTRLSQEAARRLNEDGDFEDGVFFVPLAAVTNSEELTPAVASVLGLKETTDNPVAEAVTDFLHDKRLLLVLDNMEQLPDAGSPVANILTSAPDVRILTTSRAALHVYGEQTWAVPSLSLPARDTLVTAATLSQSEAADLFIQRARSARSDFALDEESAPAVAQIVRMLDGLPLAIELAAARTRVLSPSGILSRLKGHNHLKLIVGGPSNLTPRQQTLRGAIDWSYALLDGEEKTLFHRMSVFVGGSTVEAAEAMAGDVSSPLDLVSALVDKSLLRQDPDPNGELRLTMLETIREYGLEKLAESGEEAEIRRRHALLMMELAVTAGPYLPSPHRDPWMARLDAELDNIRAALAWSVSEGGDAEVGLRLAGALGWYWYFRGYFVEGRRWLDAILNRVDHERHSLALAGALYASAKLAEQHFDLDVARAALLESAAILREQGERRLLAYTLVLLARVGSHRLEHELYELADEGLEIFRETGDLWGLAHGLDLTSGIAYRLGDAQASITRELESLQLYRQLGDTRNVASLLGTVGLDAVQLRDYGLARTCFGEAIPLLRKVGDRYYLGHVLFGYGMVAHLEGVYDEAETYYQESFALYQALGDRGRMGLITRHIGYVAYRQGQYERALSLHKEATAIYMELGRKRKAAVCVASIAGIALAADDPRLAARLLGVPLFYRPEGVSFVTDTTVGAAEYEQQVVQARQELGDTEFEVCIAEGQTLSVDRALSLTYPMKIQAPANRSSSDLAHTPGALVRGLSYPNGLSKREVELLRLVATGLNNSQVAAQLFLSTNTVRAHLYSIYSKISVSSRTEAALFAVKQGLA